MIIGFVGFGLLCFQLIEHGHQVCTQLRKVCFIVRNGRRRWRPKPEGDLCQVTKGSCKLQAV
jgi:hypothetical protein